jgi:hypothetical protein
MTAKFPVTEADVERLLAESAARAELARIAAEDARRRAVIAAVVVR